MSMLNQFDQSKNQSLLNHSQTVNDQMLVISSSDAQEDMIMLKQKIGRSSLAESTVEIATEAKETLKKIKIDINEKKMQISKKKQQLKEISQKLQTQLQKAILKTTETSTKDISYYFSKQEEQFTTQKQKILKSEIKKVRIMIQKTKKQINKLRQAKLQEPNEQKYIEYQNKLTTKNQEIKKLQALKSNSQHQIQIVEQSISNLHLLEVEQNVKKYTDKILQLNKQLKQQRINLNTLERQDRSSMQKIKYLLQVINQSENKKILGKAQLQKKQQIQLQMTEHNQQIKKMMIEKQKSDQKIKSQYESLKVKKQKLEKENWNIVIKLREYDNFLLNHYNHLKHSKPKKQSVQDISVNQSRNSQRIMSHSLKKVQKKSSKLILQKEQLSNELQKLPQKLQRPQQLQQLQQQQQQQQQQQIKTIPEILPKQEKNNYTPFQIQDLQSTIIITDDFHDSQYSLIEQITLYHTESNLLGIYTTYHTQFGVQDGYKMHSVIKVKDSKSMNLKIDSSTDKIQLIQFGVKNKQIYSLKIQSRLNKSIKWQAMPLIQNQQLLKLEQKKIQIPDHISIRISACLKLFEEAKTPNDYILNGLGFHFITLQEAEYQEKVIGTHKITKNRVLRSRKIKKLMFDNNQSIMS